jgi:hypothetical protein
MLQLSMRDGAGGCLQARRAGGAGRCPAQPHAPLATVGPRALGGQIMTAWPFGFGSRCILLPVDAEERCDALGWTKDRLCCRRQLPAGHRY